MLLLSGVRCCPGWSPPSPAPLSSWGYHDWLFLPDLWNGFKLCGLPYFWFLVYAIVILLPIDTAEHLRWGKRKLLSLILRCKLIRRGISLEEGHGDSYTWLFPWAFSFIIFIARKSVLFCVQNCWYCLTGGCVPWWSLKVVDMSTDQGSSDAQGHCWVCISLDF